MDTISHGLIGRLFVGKQFSKKDKITVAIFAMLPDFTHIPLSFYLGFIKNREYYYPHISDWDGFRETYPLHSMLWEIPHSLFFLIIIALIVKHFNLTKWAILAYFSHIFVDIFTHTGEWSVKPLFPINIKIEGFTEAWKWGIGYFMISWIGLIFCIIISDKIRAYLAENKA